MKLPTRLNKSPLVDSLFELRFNGDDSLVDVASGILFSKLETKLKPKITRLANAELPRQLRENDPNLRYSPIVRIELEDYIIGLSEHSLQINCKLPYKGWDAFFGFISDVLAVLHSLNMINEVVRYSLKYTDLVEINGEINEQLDLTSLNVNFGEREPIPIDNLWLRAEVKEFDFIHIISIVTSAEARIRGHHNLKHGVIVETDTIKDNFTLSFSEWLSSTHNSLHYIHELNKKMFFRCLKVKTIDSMEPSYE